METERTLGCEMLLDSFSSEQYHEGLQAELIRADPEIQKLISREYQRLQDTIQLLAAENQCSRAVLAALGSIIQNKTSEGFPNARLHGGSSVMDDVERIAAGRAMRAFGAKYANVQPHSGTTANQIVINALLEPGDRILSMATSHGGHYSHGSIDSITSRFFQIETYCVDRKSYMLDYDQIAKQARNLRPKLIICGASSYPRIIDFSMFRKIADEVGAILLSDVSHVSALIIAGVHPSPIDCAHITTTSTYKPGGPRGGLILMGKDFEHKVGKMPIWRQIEKMTFPGIQGTPYFNNIAAKAVFFKEVLSDNYKTRQRRVVENAKCLADDLVKMGYELLTGGTDNHLMLIKLTDASHRMTGFVAQKCLEDCGIVVDRMRLPYDERPDVTSGIRLGTPIITKNGMGVAEIGQISSMLDSILRRVRAQNDTEYIIPDSLRAKIAAQTKELAHNFPIH